MSDSNDGAAVPAGWYPDPADPSSVRRWDGAGWTDDVLPASEAPQPTQVALPSVPDAPARPRISGWGSDADAGFSNDDADALPDWMNKPGLTLPPDLSSLSTSEDPLFPSRPSFDDSSIDAMSTAPPVFGKPVFRDEPEPEREPEPHPEPEPEPHPKPEPALEPSFDEPPRQSPVPLDFEPEPEPAPEPESEAERAVEQLGVSDLAPDPVVEPERADPQPTEAVPDATPPTFSSRRARRAALPVEVADDEAEAEAEARAAAESARTPQIPSAPYAPPPVGVQYIAPLPPGVDHVEPAPHAYPASALGEHITPSWSPSTAAPTPQAAPPASVVPTNTPAPLERMRGLPSVAVEPGPVVEPEPQIRSTIPLAVPVPTRSSTLGVWLMAILPLVQFVAIYYIFQVLAAPFEPTLKWGVLAAPAIFGVIFAALDRRRLANEGFEKLPSLAWGLIPPVYLFVRCLRIGPRSISALLLWLLLQVGAVVGVYLLLPAVLSQALGTTSAPIPFPADTSKPVVPGITAAERAQQLTVKGMEAKIVSDNKSVFHVVSATCPPLTSTASGTEVVCTATLKDGSKLLLTERVDALEKFVAFVQVSSKPKSE